MNNFDFKKFLTEGQLYKEAMDYTGGVSFDDNNPTSPEPSSPNNAESIKDEIFDLWDLYFDNREGIEVFDFSNRKDKGLSVIVDNDTDGEVSAFAADLEQVLEDKGIKYQWMDEESLTIYLNDNESLNEEESNNNFTWKPDEEWDEGNEETPNISYSDVDQILEKVKLFGAEEMEYFFRGLQQHFKDSVHELTNMDSEGLSQDMWNAYDKLRNRTGN